MQDNIHRYTVQARWCKYMNIFSAVDGNYFFFPFFAPFFFPLSFPVSSSVPGIALLLFFPSGVLEYQVCYRGRHESYLKALWRLLCHCYHLTSRGYYTFYFFRFWCFFYYLYPNILKYSRFHWGTHRRHFLSSAAHLSAHSAV